MLNDRRYEFVAWGCVLVVLAGFLWELIRGDWSDALSLAIFLFATFLFLLYRKQLPPLFSFLFALASLCNALGWAFDFYDKVPGWDPFCHAFTTFAGALAVGFLVFHSSVLHFRDYYVSYALSIAAYGLSLGGLWEVFEWSIGVGQSYGGVIGDLAMDTLGGVVAGILAAWIVRNQTL